MEAMILDLENIVWNIHVCQDAMATTEEVRFFTVHDIDFWLSDHTGVYMFVIIIHNIYICMVIFGIFNDVIDSCI